MCEGVRRLLPELWSQGRLDGALCLGGAEGALLGAAGMHALPVGVAKLIVSPSASGRRSFGPFMGETDTCVMHSVIDILGINPISRAVFDNAAAAIVGMARSAGVPVGELGDRTIAITMLGQTTPGVMRLRERLAEAGLDSVVFHANGVGGPAMERLLEQGALGGVIDFTLSEIANSVKDGIHAVGPERLTVAGRLGSRRSCPRVRRLLQPGPARDDPEAYRARRSYFHNRVATLVGTSEAVMREIAGHDRRAAGRRARPVRGDHADAGVLALGRAGRGALGRDRHTAFLDALKASLDPAIVSEAVDAPINAPAFADHVGASRGDHVRGRPGLMSATRSVDRKVPRCQDPSDFDRSHHRPFIRLAGPRRTTRGGVQ
jgi:uncharacterized protein (UPF0261 family)